METGTVMLRENVPKVNISYRVDVINNPDDAWKNYWSGFKAKFDAENYVFDFLPAGIHKWRIVKVTTIEEVVD